MRILFQILAVAVMCSQAAWAADVPRKRQKRVPQKPVIQSIVPSIVKPCTNVPDFTKLAERIYYLDKGAFDPSQVGPNYNPPSINTNDKLIHDSDEWKSLDIGYTAASDGVKKELCGLKYILVNRAEGDDTTWGFWESPDQVPDRRNAGGFIAISLNQLKSPEKLSDHENSIFNRLIENKDWADPPTISANPNTPALAVLAMLTHELGHVLYLDRRDGKDANTCFEKYFVQQSWRYSKGRPDPRWITFGDEGGWEHPDDAPAGGPKDAAPAISAIQNAVNTNKDDARVEISEVFLKKYGKKPREHYVSLFAAVSAEEDLIETYKFAALKAAKTGALKSLSLQVNNKAGDEIELMTIFDNPNGRAKQKRACLKSFTNP